LVLAMISATCYSGRDFTIRPMSAGNRSTTNTEDCMVISGRMRLINRMFLRMFFSAVAVYFLGCAPVARASTTSYMLCFNDVPGATLCNVGDFVLITSDGSTVTTSTGGTASDPIPNTVSTFGSSTTVGTTAGETVGNWTISGNSGSANFSTAATIASSLAFSAQTSTTGTLNIYWLAYGYPSSDTTNGSPIAAISGTTAAGLSDAAGACGQVDGAVTNPTAYKECNGATAGTAAIVMPGASAAVVTELGTASSTGPTTFSAFSGGSPFNPGTTFLLEQEMTITSTATSAVLTTGFFTLDVAPTPEPATLGFTAAGLALLAAGAYRRRKLSKPQAF